MRDEFDTRIGLNIGLIAPIVITMGMGVQRDKAYLELLIEILEFVVDEVEQAVAAGLSLEETKGRVSLDRFESRIAGGNSLKEYLFRHWFGIIGPAYQEAKEAETDSP